MRVFVCSLLTAEQQAFYGTHIGTLVAAHCQLLRGIPPATAHLTYAFLPHVENIDDVVDAVREATANARALPIVLGRPAILFGGSEARLIYAPVVGDVAPLRLLAKQIAARLAIACPAADVSASKSLHVTLARFRKGTRRRETSPVADDLANAPEWRPPRHDVIAGVEVMSSVLGLGGPRYQVEERLLLS
jgi:2'-5' RNA ligase